MSNLNKEIEDALAEIDVPTDKELRKYTGHSIRTSKMFTEEYSTNMSKKVKSRYEDTAYLNQHSKRIKEICNTEEFKLKRLSGVRQKFKDEVFVKRHKDGAKKRIACGNGRYLGGSIGTNIKTGEVIILHGAKEIKDAGFSQSKVSECINGKRIQHKGYTWKREAK
jgi:hypothetical protein